ncbi:MAG: competence protein ComFC [Chlamydiales bacterium]
MAILKSAPFSTMLSLLRKITEPCIHIIYPPICLCCQEYTPENLKIFCPGCNDLLTPIEASERCPFCFSLDYNTKRRICAYCAKKKRIIYKFASVFDYLGPAATLVKSLKYSNQFYLSKGSGAHMASYLLNLGWPIPDVIIPVPITLTHWLQRGFNQSRLLADSMSEILTCPVQEALKRDNLAYSQAELSLKQRLQMKENSFTLKKKQNLSDKVVLIVDDVSTTGTTLNRCAATILPECPTAIYALTLCLAP